MSEIEEGLLRGKKQNQAYKKRFGDCEMKIRALRNKNNELQKQCDNDLANDIRKAINEQSKFVSAEIQSIRKMIQQLSRDFKDPPSKHKIKELWEKCAKQFERNKRIMEQFVNRASESIIRRSTMRISKTEMQNDHKPSKDVSKNGVSLIESQDVLIDVQFQHKMMAEKNQLLRELEEKNLKINRIMNEMGEMVGGEQRDMIDQIDVNMVNAHQNVKQANQELDKAQTYSKKSKKKYICVVVLIIVCLIAGGGVIFFLLR